MGPLLLLEATRSLHLLGLQGFGYLRRTGRPLKGFLVMAVLYGCLFVV